MRAPVYSSTARAKLLRDDFPLTAHFFLQQNIVEINPVCLQCSLISASSGEPTAKTFTFDGVYDQTSTTEQIYNDFGYPLVEVRYLSVCTEQRFMI